MKKSIFVMVLLGSLILTSCTSKEEKAQEEAAQQQQQVQEQVQEQLDTMIDDNAVVEITQSTSTGVTLTPENVVGTYAGMTPDGMEAALTILPDGTFNLVEQDPSDAESEPKTSTGSYSVADNKVTLSNDMGAFIVDGDNLRNVEVSTTLMSGETAKDFILEMQK